MKTPIASPFILYRNHYRHCDQEWADVWPVENTIDYCPLCNGMVKPHSSLEVTRETQNYPVNFNTCINNKEYKIYGFMGNQADYQDMVKCISEQEAARGEPGLRALQRGHVILPNGHGIQYGQRTGPIKDRGVVEAGDIKEFELTSNSYRRYRISGPYSGTSSEDVTLTLQLNEIERIASDEEVAGFLKGAMSYGDATYIYHEIELPQVPAEELSKGFILHIANIAERWGTKNDYQREFRYTPVQMCHGVIHDVLKVIDGADKRWPAMQLTTSPYRQNQDGRALHLEGTTGNAMSFPMNHTLTPDSTEGFSGMYRKQYDSFRAKFSACAKDLFD